MVSRRSRQVSVLEECLYGCYYAAPDDIYHIRGIRGRRYLGGALSSTLVPAADQVKRERPRIWYCQSGAGIQQTMYPQAQILLQLIIRRI